MNGERAPFLHSATMKGDTAMDTSMPKKPDWVDYATAHPLGIPLWVAVFAWLVQVFSVGWFWLFQLLWLTGYLYSAPRLFAYYGRQEAGALQESGFRIQDSGKGMVKL